MQFLEGGGGGGGDLPQMPHPGSAIEASTQLGFQHPMRLYLRYYICANSLGTIANWL